MDGIEGLLARDFGMRPQGKAAPMAGAASRPAAGSTAGTAAAWSNPTRSIPAPPSITPSYGDLFGSTSTSPAPTPASASSFETLFHRRPGQCGARQALGPAEVQGVVGKACGGHPWPMDSAPDRHKRDERLSSEGWRCG
ncbi:unnamed protein product [Urochloa humidicola]